jgi:IMP dehydrogenase
MKTLSDILRADPVWVNPTHRVASAIMLMRGHSVNGLPVLDGPKLVGMVLSEHLLGVDLRLPVNEVMDRHVVAVSPALSVREAAELMTRESLVRLPVVGQDGALLGVITNSDLLAELRRSTDPLTELPWSDSLQEWSVERLRSGQEITLLFLDIDCFGQFNKRFGHVVGDMVLKRVAAVLRQHLDPNQEILCRYGGDEFCISTLRTASMAEALGAALEKDIAGIRIQEARGEGVSVSVGIRGGRRTREREQVHYAATVNNLINLASQDCLAKKKIKAPGGEGSG